ncbi:MAG: amidase [Halieaceae bacterium]|jgi:prolyl oligopeptidase PreP (S9A serine peptidase family)/Asp-tRNA(Asn)/Glu-tRNA(Gln) amidotransferase A subunit family amidase|nr:amidase [Halieaceae bacterium]
MHRLTVAPRRIVALTIALFIGGPVQALDSGDYWLDDTYSTRALDWVERENRTTLDALGGDAVIASLAAEAAKVLTDPSRPPAVRVAGDLVFTYRQSRAAPLGVWQVSDAQAYFAGSPVWSTLIDLDELARTEGRKWIFQSASCRGMRCLVSLSDNGKDAREVREYDLETREFVPRGFFLPEGKTRSWWFDDDHLLIAPILGPDSVNESELPRTLRLWKRSTPLESAQTLFSGDYRDSGISAAFLRAGGRDGFVAVRSADFFSREYYWVDASGAAEPLRLPLPRSIEVQTVHQGQLLLRLNEDWIAGGQKYTAGSLLSLSLDPLLDDGRIERLGLIYEPGAREAIRGVVAVGDMLYVEALRDYRSVVLAVSLDADPAAPTTLPLAADGFIQLLGAHGGALLLSYESVLEPKRVFLHDPETGAEKELYRQRPAFDASGLRAELLTTRSSDGTEIAYTLIGPAEPPEDAPRPTLVYGYGGFDVSITPRYEPLFGKLWLEKGGVYVHAYLRGGGENGPNWHRSAMDANRLRPYEDMAAILTDLHKRGVSSPKQTGIMGRSNGGLMVSAMMTRRPELMNAVVVGGPLTDMLHYQNLPPGASWTAEYGDPRSEADAAWIARYSPYQALEKQADYPVPLVITSTDDDRVLVGHARRFAHRMTALGHEALYFEDRQGGHYWELAGGPAPGDWRLRSRARAVEFAYLAQRLGLPLPAASADLSALGHWPSVKQLQHAIRNGDISIEGLLERQILRIEQLNPSLNAVIAVDPTARQQARALAASAAAGDWRGPLHGIPVLIKDNIETRDQPTTAGSLALAQNATGRDAPLVKHLREAGAIVLGKANLSEWANFRSTRSSSGWSAIGGQSRNPYDPARSPCGSSSGSGAAVAAGMGVMAIGTETNGSIVCPSATNGLVGIKPTVGLVSRTHIVPISHSQDTAGPMARSVYGATLLLAAIMGADEADPATDRRPPWGRDDLLAHVRADGLAGKRIGILRSLTGLHSDADQRFDQAIRQIAEGGATIVDGLEWQSDDEFSQDAYDVLLFEFKHNINAYLAALPDPGLARLTLAGLIDFNRQHEALELPWFGQEIFEAAQSKGALTDAAYLEAHERVLSATRQQGIDRLLREHDLDALLAPTTSPAWTIDRVNGDHYLGGSSSLAAVAGYPNITVPMGQVHGLPVGLSIFGARYSEPTLIEIASGFEDIAGGFVPPR